MPTPTALTVVKLSRVATADPAGTAADVTNGNSVANTGGTIIRVKNSGASTYNVTFVTPGSVDGLAIGDDGPHTVAAGAVAWYSGYDTGTFGARMKIQCDNAALLLTAFEPG